ncbi:DUF2231 domain-containing protein [Beijerinckia sp. L45]|uniref:DUF2231 domain-containing protein n=1 Tax=Beijerinckia sp. L45 TaxID=1641855 RepID=UPI00131D73CA|nr:DUF2231 domain-containing protein [Beijerinckia sp. L45]
MIDDNPRSTARVPGPSFYAALVQFPIVCFFGTLLTDLAYWKTAEFLWVSFSVWLLAFGLVMAGLAFLAGLVDLARRRRVRFLGFSWVQILGQLVAALLSLLNVFVHSRDGYTAVVPEGLLLSALVVLILLVTGWVGTSMAYRTTRVGVTY